MITAVVKTVVDWSRTREWLSNSSRRRSIRSELVRGELWTKTVVSNSIIIFYSLTTTTTTTTWTAAAMTRNGGRSRDDGTVAFGLTRRLRRPNNPSAAGQRGTVAAGEFFTTNRRPVALSTPAVSPPPRPVTAVYNLEHVRVSYTSCIIGVTLFFLIFFFCFL